MSAHRNLVFVLDVSGSTMSWDLKKWREKIVVICEQMSTEPFTAHIIVMNATIQRYECYSQVNYREIVESPRFEDCWGPMSLTFLWNFLDAQKILDPTIFVATDGCISDDHRPEKWWNVNPCFILPDDKSTANTRYTHTSITVDAID